jgi:hypothetical protein
MSSPHPTPAITRCRSCGAAIWWGEIHHGKRCPFDVDTATGVLTDTSHFATCPDAKRWTKRPGRGGKHRGTESRYSQQSRGKHSGSSGDGGARRVGTRHTSLAAERALRPAVCGARAVSGRIARPAAALPTGC